MLLFGQLPRWFSDKHRLENFPIGISVIKIQMTFCLQILKGQILFIVTGILVVSLGIPFIAIFVVLVSKNIRLIVIKINMTANKTISTISSRVDKDSYPRI